MEFKKSRLDIDSSLLGMNSSIPSPGPSPCNTSSGGGGGGGGPYRGRYTRSSLGGGMPTSTSSAGSSSRFSPYAISRDRPSPRRSIPVIMARKEVEPMRSLVTPSFFGSTSSTAQKIMDTLASISTPVLNAGRVRIDSIKSVKPMAMIGSSSMLNTSGTFLSSSNKFNGPPKTMSPLLLPKSPSGIRSDSDKSMWSLKCLSIPPKMVDCGTSTDDELSIERIKQISPLVGSHRRNSIELSKTCEKSHAPLRLADLLTKSRPVNGEYKFDNPLFLGDVDKYLGSDQYKKDLGRRSESSSTSNDSNDESDGNQKEDSYMSSNKIPNGDDKGLSAAGSKFKLESALQSSSTSDKQWECPSCMVFNASNADECVCCTTKNPDKKSGGKIDNPTTLKAVKSSENVEKWSCPTCMVPNEASAAACVCCSERNPNAVQDTKSKDIPLSQPSIPSFKFGFSSASGFKFGTPSQNTTSTTLANDNVPGSFAFGFNKSTTPATHSEKPTTNVLKNTNNISTTGDPAKIASPNASSGTFKFGATSTDEELPIRNSKTIELWHCDVCSTENELGIFSCRMCGSPRPQEFDTGYKKPENKSKADVKFQPMFGVKSPSISSSGFSASPMSTPIVTSNNSAFGNSTFTTLNSGNPFGGSSTVGTFGGVATFGSSGNNTAFSVGSNSAIVESTQVDGGIRAGTPSSTKVDNSPAVIPSFQFGTASASPAKRKHDGAENSDNDAKKPLPSFQFGSPANAPALKLKETVPAFTIPAPSPTPSVVTGSNPAGFLEALKNASAAVKASNEKQPNMTAPSLGEPTNKLFQFGSSNPTTTSTSIFGTSTFGTSTAAPSAPFNFGSSSAGATLSSPIQTAMSGNQQPSSGVPTSNPNTQFNLTPNFNFGATGPSTPGTFNFGATQNAASSNSFSFGSQSSDTPSGAPPPLFQFSSNPSSNAGGDMQGRRIKKAARRLR